MVSEGPDLIGQFIRRLYSHFLEAFGYGFCVPPQHGETLTIFPSFPILKNGDGGQNRKALRVRIKSINNAKVSIPVTGQVRMPLSSPKRFNCEDVALVRGDAPLPDFEKRIGSFLVNREGIVTAPRSPALSRRE